MTMNRWANFAVLVGGASAALTGLLFVAVSLNLDRILGSAPLRAAAAQTLIVLVSPCSSPSSSRFSVSPRGPWASR